MARIVNLTPHPLVLMDADENELVTIPPTGEIARCSMERRVVETIEVEGGSMPLTEVVLGELSGLPESVEGTLFVVSRVAAEAAKGAGRSDVVCPDDAVRDSAGRIIGCKALSRV